MEFYSNYTKEWSCDGKSALKTLVDVVKSVNVNQPLVILSLKATIPFTYQLLIMYLYARWTSLQCCCIHQT